MARTMTVVASELRERRAATVGWPAIGFVLAVLVAAVYSFAPRQNPPFPPTYVHPDGLLVNGLARAGSRLVAVGDQGHILLADAPNGPWHEAKVVNERGSALTQVRFIDDSTAIAVGHDGWILRSTDRGETWQEVAFDPDQGNALLGIAGPYDGRLFVFGGFGELQASDDGGLSWHRISLDDPGKAAAAAKPAAAAQPVDPNAFPFGDTSSVAAGEDRHVYGLTRSGDGSLILVGERGLLMRSRDKGDHWESLPQIYPGSFFGVLSLKGDALLVYGMRGNVFRSADGGAHWSKVALPTGVALAGGALTPEGDVLLVGDATTVLRSHDDGQSFMRVGDEGRKALSTILPLDDSHWLTGGESGIGVVQLVAAGDAAKAAGAPR